MRYSLENQSFLAFLVLVTCAFLWVMMPFFGPIFWAVAITIIFAPVHQKLHRLMPNRDNTNALLTLLVCLVVVIIPVLFTVTTVVSQVASFYQQVDNGEVQLRPYIDKVQNAPVLQDWMARFDLSFENLKERFSESAMAAGKFVAQHSLKVGQNAFGFALDVGILLYVAFFLLRDGEKIMQMLYKALPLGDERERLLFHKFAEVTRATVKGNVLISIIQGSIGGITFALLGIPGAFLWGVVMVCASLLPAIGAGIVWVPVAVYLLAIGSYFQAITLVLVGVFIIGLVDNILRPILVGRDTKLPDYIVLLSTLGGLVLFGINGFVIGPLIAAMFVAFWGIFIREFQTERVEGSGAEPETPESQE